MTKSRYPDTIYFCDQLMTSRISLKDEYKIERKAMRRLQALDKENNYISVENQALFVLQFSDELQLFVDALAKPLNAEYDFIITCEDNPKILYSATEHHSFLANGKKVLASGSLIFKEGILEAVSNNSGHYRPTDDEMLQAIKALHTLSAGCLTSYISYCTLEILEYSVEELLTVDSFESIKPLRIVECLDSDSVLPSVVGYDGIDSKNRHRLNLSDSLIRNYKYIIEHGHPLFSSTVELPSHKYENVVEIVFVDEVKHEDFTQYLDPLLISINNI